MTNQEKEIVQSCIQDMVDSFTRIAAERDLQKSIVAKIKETTTVTPKIFRKMAKTAYASNFVEEVSTNEEFEVLYKEIMNVSE